MTVRRIMGIETEYGILEPGNPWANPVELSTSLVEAYAAAVPHAAWDYVGEDPLCDARGYRLRRDAAYASQLTDEAAGVRLSGLRRGEVRGGPANAVLTSGARLYVDHAHPEYSSPEVTGPRDAVVWDRAGDEIMLEAMAALLRSTGREVVVYKNNVDGKGASYGTHENYLVERSVPFHELARRLIPFLVTRPVVCGSGRVGLGQRSQDAGFQISQRADYIENDVGLETTFHRPIVNTRDEPHADARWRRLHIIGGDANRFDVPAYLKFATTALVLRLIEQDQVPLELDALSLAAPVADCRGVSHDPFGHVLSTAGGRLRALDVQRIHLDVIARHVDHTEPETSAALALWDAVLTGLADDPSSVAHRVEWVAKHQLLEGLRRRGNLSWDHPRLRAFDLQWADLRPERSVIARLDAAGRIERLAGQAEVDAARTTPPPDTRAFFRGTMVARHPVVAAGWTSVVVDSPSRAHLVRIPLIDPYRGTRDRTARLFESADIDELLAALGGR